MTVAAMQDKAATTSYETASQDFLYAARAGAPVDSFLRLLAAAPEDSLRTELSDDHKRLAFWINIYNAVNQSTLRQNPDLYQDRNAFFKMKLITIAGHPLSLDDIEHGILRRSKNKLSLGYLNKWFPGKFEKKFRVDRLDYRIHFALNCGARSCPPIAFYDAAKIDEQLQTAMTGHLRIESDYDSVHNTVAVTAFMGWFRADFGGKRGIRKLLRNAGVIPADRSPKIVFKKYDWKLYLDNFKE